MVAWEFLGFALVALVGLALAGLVWRSSATSSAGRTLASLLTAESLFAAGLGYIALRPDTEYLDGEVVLYLFVFSMFYVLAGLNFRLLATLQTPLVRPLKTAAARRFVLALHVVGPGIGLALAALTATGRFDFEQATPAQGLVALAWFLVGGFMLVLSAVYSLLAAWSAHHRAPLQSVQRRRTGAYLAAFGTRDGAFLVGLVVSEVVGVFVPAGRVREFFTSDVDTVTIVVGNLAFMALLAYGMLRSRLFDLDLKVKIGIRRSTAVTLGLVLVLGAAKVAEAYLNRTFGLLAGGIAAGAVLVYAPRLNKLGDKVANTAMPSVQPTPAYIQYKKLEVYKAAVESAIETGGVTDKERASLGRLGAKLGLSPEDCRALEADVPLFGPGSGTAVSGPSG